MKAFRHLIYAACLIGGAYGLSSCSDDDEKPYPRMRSDFFDVLIDKDSIATDIILDNGKSYTISNRESFTTSVCDTVIRCYGNHEISSDSIYTKVYALSTIRCTAPNLIKIYEKDIKKDYPINIVSIYKARKYINVIFNIKKSGQYDHVFDFIKDSITTSADGTRMIHLTFLHWQPTLEVEAYTQKYYMCLPLDASYYDTEESFDSVEICINTIDGLKRFKYAR